MRRNLVLPLIALASVLGAAAVDAQLVFRRGGQPISAGGGASEAFGTGGTYARFQNGQTFVTWPDIDTGAAGNDWRYKIVRSNAPIDAGNYGAATVIADRQFNNSGMLSGGSPDNSPQNSTNQFTQANRQSAGSPMLRLSDLGSELDPFTGLQVYTALATETAYYGVIARDCPGGICSGSPAETFIGSVGPIAESVATPRPIKWAASGSRANSGNQITDPAGKAVLLNLHQSSATAKGGPATGGVQGDYWTAFIPAADQYYFWDGAPTTAAVFQNSTTQELHIGFRDSLWSPSGAVNGQEILETFWSGIGAKDAPNPFMVDNRRHLGTRKMLERWLTFFADHYGFDVNQIRWKGQSMGAMGALQTGMRMTPKISSIWAIFPVFQMHIRGCGSWPGNFWNASWPYIPDVAAAACVLGSDPDAVLLPDGTPWGGDGNYADTLALLTADPGEDLPVVLWMANKQDQSILSLDISFAHQLDALAAFQSARRGHAFIWNYGNHTGEAGLSAFECTMADPSCYPPSLFQLDLAYLAFSNSSIDDDPGTATQDANGFFDGDAIGCVNCGFKWTITEDSAGAFNFTVDNEWMDEQPTVIPQTVLVGSIPASGSGTVEVADASVFISTAGNPYASASGTEIFVISGVNVGANTVNFSARGNLGTTARAHSPGAVIRQYPVKPTGPNGGPYATMTADITPRRRQGFLPANGASVVCTVTPHGGSPVVQNLTVANELFTLVDVTINATGATSVACNE
ncbi:MAG: hypothetical protein AB7H90_11465 [Alphaproteobacteria bacterium]